MSEEGKEIHYLDRKCWRRTWVVDPLDGTKEFIKRNGEFTVNIALVEDGKPILGVIYLPVKQVLYYASTKIGAYKISGMSSGLINLDKLLSSSLKLPANIPKTKFTIVASRSHMTAETTKFVNEMQRVHGVIELLSAGSALKICLVAEGVADVYPRFGPTMEWDTAAGQVIVECSGKQFIDAITQRPMTYNKEILLNNSFIVR